MQSLNREVCLSRGMQRAGRRIGGFVAAIALHVVTAGSTASAATITVNPGQTIASGIASAVSGDTVVVNAGSYTGSINGTTGVTVRANGVVNVDGSAGLTCNNCSIIGFKFTGGSVWINGDDVLFEGNDLNGMTAGGEDYGNVFGSRITIRRNYLHGVRIPEDLGPGPDYLHNDCLQFWNNNGETLHDAIIEENIFTDFVQGVFLANETGDLSSMSNLTIRNNIFWGTDFISDGNLLGNPSHGLFVGKADITGVSITNNLFYNVANCVSLYAMSTAIVQGNVILNGGTAYAVGDGTQASAFNRGTIGNVLWSNGWNGAPSQGPDKYLDPQLANVNSLLGIDGLPWTSDDGWRPLNPLAINYGPQIVPGEDPDQLLADLRDSLSALDSNNDGFLSLTESGLTLAVFALVDVDQDGLISIVELLQATAGPVGVMTPVYVDFNYIGWEDGTLARPFNSLFEAANFVAPGGSVAFAAAKVGELIQISGPMTLTR